MVRRLITPGSVVMELPAMSVIVSDSGFSGFHAIAIVLASTSFWYSDSVT
ncbi:MAG: hypothetical protein V8Q54_06990 [Alistipes senegalensis]